MIEEYLGSKMHRALLVGRQADTTALQLCLTNCLYGAVTESLNTCNFDVACMCGQDGFRNSTLTCAKAGCAQGNVTEDIIESTLNTVLDQCADGAFSVPTTTGDDSIKTTKTTSRHSSTNTSSPSKDDSGPSTGLIAGAAVGGVVLVALFGILIWWLVKRSKRRAALDNKPAFYPNSAPVTPALDDGKLGGAGNGGQPMTQANFPGGFAGYNGQPYQQYNTTASTNYANSTATGPSTFGAPHAELGYVPPSQFDQFGAGAVGAASFAATNGGNSGQKRPTSLYPANSSTSGGSSAQLLTTASPPSQSGSSGSRPGTSDAGVGGFNPYLQPQQQQQSQPPLQLHQAPYDPYAASGAGAGGSAQQWPADVKRPLNVMSADETPQPEQPDAPPMYTRQ